MRKLDDLLNSPDANGVPALPGTDDVGLRKRHTSHADFRDAPFPSTFDLEHE